MKYCEGPDRAVNCIACHIPEGDQASVRAVNLVMNALDPNAEKPSTLKSWVHNICKIAVGSDPEAVERTLQEIRAGNCTISQVQETTE